MINVAVVGWNTFAQAYNTYAAMQAVPAFVSDLKDFFFDSDDSDSKASIAKLVILLALMSVVGGVILTATIVNRSIRFSAIRALDEGREERRRNIQAVENS